MFTIGCKAQTINIEDQNGTDIPGAYYKDSNNLLNPFTGTYIYTSADGNKSLKIVLQKKLMSSFHGYYTEDLLIGEFQYVENGVEKANTLGQLNDADPDQSHHSISGNTIFTNGSFWCNDCTPGEKRLLGGIVEKSTHNYAQLIIAMLFRKEENKIITIDFTPSWG